ncbi:MAG TPA: hypothetical protein DCM05_02805 [Elusimicrobia bacterium]|nr:hypothetical protein [Elusimicrobiota bacterium]
MNNLYSNHRKSLMSRLSDGLTLLSGGAEVLRNGDVSHPFRQDSDFLYLSGVGEPNCHLLLDPKRRTSTLFIQRIDAHHKVWEGYVPGLAECRKLYGFERVAYSDELPKRLKKAKKGYRKFYPNIAALAKHAKLLPLKKKPCLELADLLQELRALKDEGELALMKKAGDITARAHRRVMDQARPGMREYEAQALFDSACLGSGLKHLAFPSIVAAGNNGAVLHYRKNDAVLKNGELLLVDAGAEHNGYAADITRTFPVGRRFTPLQRDVYAIVLETQKSCIEMLRPGLNSAELHVHSMTMLADGLKSIGLLTGDTTGLVESEAVRLFYPHGIGHLLGLDVHDGAGGSKRKLENPFKFPIRFVAKLEPGFVITIEPGLYFIEALLNDPKKRAKYKNSVRFSKAEKMLGFGGVRIEDDLLVRNGAPLNLTDSRVCPKEIAQIEDVRRAALCRSS